MTTLLRLVFTSITLLQIVDCFSQNCLKVLDKSNNSEVAFATVKFNKSGLYTAEKGAFCLDELGKADSITISAVGYESIVLSVKKLLVEPKILLNPIPISLETVTIKPNRSKIKVLSLGYFKAKGSRKSLTPNSNKQYATFIQNEFGEEKTIEKVKVAVKPFKNEKISAFKIRVRLYGNSTDNKPNKDLLLSNVIVDFHKKTKNIEANISKFGIKLPINGVWMGVETLGYYDENNQFILSKDKQFGKMASNSPNAKLLIPLSPYYYFVETSDYGTYEKRWEGNWVKIKLNPDMTSIAVMAGLTVYSE